MNNLFKKYFGQGDANKGRAEMVYDIKENKIPSHELEELIKLMSEKGLLNEEAIDECEIIYWNENYLQSIYSRFLTGIFSASYLRYLATVSALVHKKRNRKKLLFAILLIVAIVTISFIIKILVK